MTGGIYGSEFEAMKAPPIIWLVPHTSNGETWGTIEEALHGSMLEKTNFWKNVLERLVNVRLMLAKCNLPFADPVKNFRRTTRAIFSLSYCFLPNTTLF